MTERLRVYVVDDSPTARSLLAKLLTSDPCVEVVGEAKNGPHALEEIPKRNPDLVLMDVLMLGMGGIEATRQLMQRHPVPIVLVSDVVQDHGQLWLEGLAAGAVELVRKPSALEIRDAAFARAWVLRLRSLARVPVVTRFAESPPPSSSSSAQAPKSASLVALGASTGGPQALVKLIGTLGPAPVWPVLIIQHIVAGFQAGLCRWLHESTGADVVLASAGETPVPGRYYFAPAGHHMRWSRGRLQLTPATGEGPCPSVDTLFSSLARAPIAARSFAVLMTGMGQDGAHGLQELYEAGAWTIAESEASCVVYGMSRVAVERGAAREVLALDAIARRLRGVGYRRSGNDVAR